MSIQAWVTLAVVVSTLALLTFEVAATELVLVGALTALAMTGIISPTDAASGFGSVAVITIASLFVVAAGVRRTGVLNLVVDLTLGRGGLRTSLARLMVPTATLSAFMNNTPIVAMLVPALLDWCKRRGFAPSKVLMPLSYASILGGMGTLIGTSTNLVVDSLMVRAELPGLGMFELAAVGVPAAIAGIAMVALLAPWALRDRSDPVQQLREDRREYLVEMLVEPKSPLVGRSITDAGLRRLPSLYLLTIERNERFLGPVGPSEILEADDRLVFTGLSSTVADLRQFPGLVPAAERHYNPVSERRTRLFEVVVSSSSPLVGSTARDVHFRSRYDAAMIAIHRAGERMPMKLGDVVLRPGDTLMLEASEDFDLVWTDAADFSLVSRVRGEPPPQKHKARPAFVVVLAMVTLVATGVLPMMVAAMLAAGTMVALGIVAPREVRKVVNLPVLLTVGAAIGIGRAVETSGLAIVAAAGLTSVGAQLGTSGILGSCFLATMLLTELITNTAAAALAFPVVLATATAAGLDPRPFCVVVAIAASSSFILPTGYQTNLMVYGPGGYKLGDFFRLGAPMSLAVFAVTMLVVPLVWPLR